MIGDCGILVDPESPSAIAEAIEKLLDDVELREQLGRRARERAEQTYNWRQSAHTLIEAYKKALLIRHGLE
jgi:glycosyltransferase involved in cell wall biosynthesis